jgi:amino acid adenylation domain-containing protein
VARVNNLYGPSEDTTYSTWTCVPEGSAAPVNIGRPVTNTRAYVLDAWMRPVPVGVKGEIYLGGDGLARGYLGRAGLTAEKFVPDPFDPRGGGRLYRTGDEARYLPDGRIDFLGRADFQVKIRGFRIELGEIEAALCAHPAISEAVVVAREDSPGDKRLVAYLVHEQGAGATQGELRAYLRERLPDYMIPSAMVVLESLPLTPNGKVDRRALPAPGHENSSESGSFVPPEPGVETTLAGIWSEVLGVVRVGRHDNFFDLGGHSLLATQVMARVKEVCGVELPLRSLFESPTVAALARAVEARPGRAAASSSPGEITRAPRGGELPLSFAQQRLWFVEQLEPGGAAYNVPAAFSLRGRLSAPALGQALGEVARRHEALRTTFAAEGGRARQVIHERAGVALPTVDLRAVGEAEREGLVRRLAGEEGRRPFDLERGPPLRARLVRVGEEEHVLLFTMHHIVSDGWSMGVLIKEVVALYEAFSRGGQSPLAELKIQYADYAVWQRGWLSGEVLEAQLSYWKGRLAGAPPVLELPTDKRRPPVRSFRGATEYFALPGRLSQDVNALTRREGATLFMTLMAAWQLLLSRYSGQEEVVVGTPIANRHQAESEGLIGFFANNLAVRTRVAEGETFRGLLGQVREAALGAYEHQDVPFEMVVEELQPERSLSHSPVFQVDFTMQNMAMPAIEIAGLTLAQLPVENGTAKFDLMLNITESDGRLRGLVEYSTDLFERESIRRLIEHFELLLEGIVADPVRPLSELTLLTEEERRRVLEEWNATDSEFPRGRCIHQLFEEQAARAPEAVAVTFGERELTYGELNERANRLGNYLRGLGVGPETPVGLCVERSIELVVGMLGILKAGGTYVPLDPKYPMERLAFMLEDSAVLVLLTQEALLDALPANWIQVVCLDTGWEEIGKSSAENPVNHTTAECLAYLMYTSGSTGRPKGAGITHRAVVRLVRQTRYANFGPDEVFLQLAPISFDASTFEVWGSLLNLGRLVLMPPGAPTLEELGAALRRHGVTTLWLTAGFFHLMADEQLESLLGLRQLLAGGDVLSPQLVRRVLDAPGAPTLINGYGPTENTTFTCCHPMSPGDSFGASVPVGRPIGNTQVYVLDREMRPVPLGVAGELYAGGDGLARGYHKRPALTAERFVPHPFSAEPGARLYGTRDLVRYLPGGEIEFLGRLDGQVKVRGYRIELGEIESVLAGHGSVREVVVEAREEVKGSKRLVAYVTGAPGAEPSADELRRYGRERLPEYMIPSAFVVLERLPLTANGKVDRRALPEPDSLRAELADAYVAPVTPVEEQLSHIWSEVLGVVRVGRHDNFFDLGGHSLLAIQMMARVKEVCGVELPLRSLFESPTVAALARAVEARPGRTAAAAPGEITRAPRGGELPLSFAQQRLWFVEQLEPGGAAYNVPAAFSLRGRLSAPALGQALGEVARRHEALRTTFEAEGGRARQVIHERAGVALPAVDLRGVGEAEREGLVRRLAGEEGRRPFDLERGPLLRARLVRVGEEEHVLLFTMHHIVCDAWSLGVLGREVATLYGAYAVGAQSPLAELEIQYADYAVWQRGWLSGEVLEAQLSYWKGRLAGAPPVLELPFDRPRPPAQTSCGATEQFVLPAALGRGVSELTRREGATLFMTLMAAWQLLLSRYSGQEEVVVGTPIANRHQAESEGLIGFFANNLAVRTRVAEGETFRGLLGQVREAALGAYEHQDVPFEMVVEELQPERSLSHSPLFQVVFTTQNAPAPAIEIAGLTLAQLPVENGTAKFDLVINFIEREGDLHGSIEYSTDLFERESIRRLIEHFRRLLKGIVADPGRPLSELTLLTEEERRRVLEEWNATDSEFPRGRCIHQLFEEQAAAKPEAEAVVLGSDAVTYDELNRRANRLARHLRGLGVGPGVRVGLYLEHSPETLVAILGVLKAGGAYVPFDPEHPAARLAFMLEDAEIRVILTQQRLAERLPRTDARVLRLDADWPAVARESDDAPVVEMTSDDIAYVIYTSGSTGEPKGVLIRHRSLVNYIWWAADVYLQGERLDFALYSSLAFDLTVTSIFTPLVTGNRVIVYPKTGRDIPLLNILEDDRVGVLKLTPSHLLLLKDRDNRASRIKRLVVGGEALEVELARRVLDSFGGRVEIYNEYGPTEATVGCMLHRYDEERDLRGAVPVGRPAANCRVYVLEGGGRRPAAENVLGEMYVGGECLAAGYLGREELTGERFVADPFVEGGVMYRTGDLGRHVGGGVVEYAGRADGQVKYHGYRVELGELKAALNRHPLVRDSVVLVRKGKQGRESMVAYYVSRQPLEARELREWMAGQVIAETAPNIYVHLKRLPLTLNGKVNYEALPAFEESRETGGRSRVEPRSPVELALTEIWSEVLGVGGVGAHDNFFELGGHSLLATQVLSKVLEVFQVEIPLRTLFEEPTVSGVASIVEAALAGADRVEARPPLRPVARGDELPLSFAQQRLWFVQQLEPDSPAYNVPLAVRLSGPLDVAAMRATLREIIRRHEALRTSFALSKGRPVQRVGPPEDLELPVSDLSGAPASELQRLLAEESRRPFDLSKGPVVRAGLVKLADEEHVLFCTMHHIVSDGWSMGVLVREVAALYEAFSNGLPSPLPELPVQYADFAVWQRRLLQGELLDRQLAYWREQLCGVAVLDLPTDRPRSAEQSCRGARKSFTIPEDVTAALNALGRAEGVTLFMTLLAGWQALLYRYTDQEDIAVGSAIANRNYAGVEHLIGFFVNMLVLRTDLSGNPTFGELLARVREVCLGAYAHQDVPFEKLVEELQPERALGRTPLFQVVFHLLNNPMPALEVSGLRVAPLDTDLGMPHFDLILSMEARGRELSGTLEYNTDLFDSTTADQMLKHFATLLEGVAERPDRGLLEILLDGGAPAGAPARGPEAQLAFGGHQFHFEAD